MSRHRELRVASSASARTARPAPLSRKLAVALAPIRAWALGIAVGLVTAAGLGLVTAAHLVVLPRRAPHLDLLAQYFVGYSVSPAGIFVGALWAFACGFVAGVLVAVVRNLAVRLWIAIVRMRAGLWESEFLDGI